MKRRDFLSTAGIGSAATMLAAPALAQAQPTVSWRLTSAYPNSLETLYGISSQLSQRIGEMTDGGFRIQAFSAGELVPGLQALDAASDGTVECAHTLGSYSIGKDPTWGFETALPFGLNTRQQTAWLMQGGGLELINEFVASSNVRVIPSGNTGAQMGGWYRKEINSVEDLRGLKLRIAGLGGTILSRLGVVPQQIAGGDIYSALERGTIDAAEFSGPLDDEKLGFQRVAPHYYYPGWWEGCANVGLYINLDAWNALPAHYQAALEAACAETLTHCVAKYDNGNPDALLRLIQSGAQLKAFPDDVLEAAFAESRKLYAEYAESNENFRRIYEPWSAYWQKQQQWLRVAELPYDYFNSGQVNR
ncbi:TRAP transporter substrate-binding protein [Paracoccus sp. MC1862]|uniref:TRAP transporter substrate-binding protein n=1 Tax=Paracoccus sp. MC1862 TaxID=2760307 RepID=UPI001602EB62|nr:ABC transporter substrate-binding protein [Paracoccus sp. MC1862]MBB1498629.1 ABC transporter substrate-binding protein [Paracoccus sp. MC1862]QQO46141.1 ABC transporter substrate-binding protein [Paracoccus sp. MC1862]